LGENAGLTRDQDTSPERLRRSRPWRPLWRPPPCSGRSDQRLFDCPVALRRNQRHYAPSARCDRQVGGQLL